MTDVAVLREMPEHARVLRPCRLISPTAAELPAADSHPRSPAQGERWPQRWLVVLSAVATRLDDPGEDRPASTANCAASTEKIRLLQRNG